MDPPNDMLFSSDLWEVALEKYGQATHLTVELFDADLRVVFGPIHPTPLFRLFDEANYDPGIMAECAQRCLVQTEQRPAVMISQVGGLAVIGTSLVLAGNVVAAAVAGYAFIDFSQSSEVQNLARRSGIPFERIWRVSRQQKPVPQGRLTVHGELLQALGDALLRENYRTRQYEQVALRLLRAQDDQNRRIGRELHDSVGQYLSYAKIMLTEFINRPDTTEKGMQALSQVAESIDKSLVETRTISYLLHPPLLDELGLRSAVEAFLEGFTRRSGVQVNLKISDMPNRLPYTLELMLFRILQESLTNVVRHSESQSVDVTLKLGKSEVELAVRDYGKGIAPELLKSFKANGQGGGIGLNSMRERTKESDGRFEIESNGQGTLVRVMFPVPAADHQPAGVTTPPEVGNTLH
ncbi:MAG TPA: sensor histidine kinase [Terriglobia bacterium]|nr:sensor histidine kinase [Terriglobia bacterium]